MEGTTANPEATSPGSADTTLAGGSAAEQYARLHAATPEGTLQAGDLSLADALRLLEREVSPGIVLVRPSWVPPGMRVAAPFRGTGNGSALPNPHVWPGGWALTLTDGRARLTVVVGADEEFSGEWVPVADGKGEGVEIQHRPTVLLARRQMGTGSLVVVGERMPEADLLRVVRGLSLIS